MSSILKALRKLDDDNAALGKGTTDIGRDILKRRYEDHPARNHWLLIGGGMLLTVVILTLVWLNPFGSEEQTELIRFDQSSLSAVKESDVSEGSLSPTATVLQSSPAPQTHYSEAETRQQPVETAQPSDIPELTISEIVFDPRPEARLAIVNDLPVMEATQIDGVRVDKILPDRVLFSREKVKFVRFVRQQEKE